MTAEDVFELDGGEDNGAPDAEYDDDCHVRRWCSAADSNRSKRRGMNADDEHDSCDPGEATGQLIVVAAVVLIEAGEAGETHDRDGSGECKEHWWTCLVWCGVVSVQAAAKRGGDLGFAGQLPVVVRTEDVPGSFDVDDDAVGAGSSNGIGTAAGVHADADAAVAFAEGNVAAALRFDRMRSRVEGARVA